MTLRKTIPRLWRKKKKGIGAYLNVRDTWHPYTSLNYPDAYI